MTIPNQPRNRKQKADALGQIPEDHSSDAAAAAMAATAQSKLPSSDYTKALSSYQAKVAPSSQFSGQDSSPGGPGSKAGKSGYVKPHEETVGERRQRLEQEKLERKMKRGSLGAMPALHPFSAAGMAASAGSDEEQGGPGGVAAARRAKIAKKGGPPPAVQEITQQAQKSKKKRNLLLKTLDQGLDELENFVTLQGPAAKGMPRRPGGIRMVDRGPKTPMAMPATPMYKA
jgi:hypothetical protein